MRILALALLLIATVAGCGRETPFPQGRYRAEIAGQAGVLPFVIAVTGTAQAPAAAILNGDNRVPAEATHWDGATLTLDFPSYQSQLEATAQADGRLAGTAHLYRRSGRLDLPLTLIPGDAPRFALGSAPPAAPLAGSWPIAMGGEDGEKGVLILREQPGGRIAGTIQFPSGDERWLAGNAAGDRFALSTFDGNQGSVWRGTILPDGRIRGDSFGPASAAPEPWSGGPREAAPAADFTAIAEEKPPTDHIDFRFPDADGHRVSLSDPQFRGKVVVVAIGGTWCPNCHDEAAFLAPYVKAHAAEGLTAIGLQFEYDADAARSARQIKRFAARYGITYPLLIAGAATPASTRRALPAIGGVKVYPTTLFIDRKGKLRAIHVGYAGPATGALHDRAVADFDALVRRLLAEKG